MLSETDVSGLLRLAGKLFPRESPERIALVESAALRREFDPATCDGVLREHAGLHEFLNVPRLREAMADAHADPDARANRERAETERRIAGKVREKADADDEFDRNEAAFDALRKARPAFVAERADAICKANAVLAAAVQRRGIDGCHTLKVLILAEAGEGATHAA